LNELLAAQFDDSPLMEYVDLMMYGFWGEGHTSDLPSPFPDYLTAEKTFTGMTELQLNLWKKVQLAVNTQPDISKVGNNRVLDMCVRAGWRQASFILPRGMDGQQVKIKAAIETKAGVRRPVRWACAQSVNPDGSLTVQLLKHDDKRWRKGV